MIESGGSSSPSGNALQCHKKFTFFRCVSGYALGCMKKTAEQIIGSLPEDFLKVFAFHPTGMVADMLSQGRAY